MPAMLRYQAFAPRPAPGGVATGQQEGTTADRSFDQPMATARPGNSPLRRVTRRAVSPVQVARSGLCLPSRRFQKNLLSKKAPKPLPTSPTSLDIGGEQDCDSPYDRSRNDPVAFCNRLAAQVYGRAKIAAPLQCVQIACRQLCLVQPRGKTVSYRRDGRSQIMNMKPR